MDFGALQTDLVQTMTLELTNYMTIYDQSFKNSRFWGGKRFLSLRIVIEIKGNLSTMSSKVESKNF